MVLTSTIPCDVQLGDNGPLYRVYLNPDDGKIVGVGYPYDPETIARLQLAIDCPDDFCDTCGGAFEPQEGEEKCNCEHSPNRP